MNESTSGKVCSIPECNRPFRAKGYCRPHYRRFTEYGDALATPIAADFDVDGQRICSKCGKKKPMKEYAPDSRCKNGRKRKCRRCTAAYVALWNKDDEGHIREHITALQKTALMRRKYGEDGVLIHKRRLAGEGCDICGHRTTRMAVDHDHETGKVRGLLCKECNWTLGLVNDDSNRLRKMADYLDRIASAMD